MNTVAHLFTHRCAACGHEFRHPSSREELIASYHRKNPSAQLSSLHIFCNSCYDHVRKFPQAPKGNFIFVCAGCGMSHMIKDGQDKDVYPVLFIPLKEIPERVCEACYEKALGALN